MATGKVLNSSFSLSNGFKDIFSCCFSTNTKETRKVGELRGKEEKAEDFKTGSGEGEAGGGKEENECESEDVGIFSPLIQDTEPESARNGSEDEFRDSPVDDYRSNSSQLNLKDSSDGETMDAMETEESGKPIVMVTRSGTRREDDGEGGRRDASSNEPADAASPADPAADLQDADDDEVDGSIRCGKVRLTLLYNGSEDQRLTVTIHETSDIPEQDRVNLSHSEVHFLLLPAKKFRYKTKAKTGDNPHFEETFRVKVTPDELVDCGLRVRLYKSESLKKEQLIGELYLAFSSLDLHLGAPHSTWITLEPRQNISNVASSEVSIQTQTLTSQAELMIGLTYNGTIGRLSVEIIQATNIRIQNSTKPPDSYVKVRLMSASGQELGRSKTSIRKNQPNPFYKEPFVFHVPQIQLPEVSLLVSLFAHRNLKKGKMIGWITLGHTNSTDDTLRHWKAMINSKGEQISHWHPLLTP